MEVLELKGRTNVQKGACVCVGGGGGGGWGKLDFCKTLLLQDSLHYINCSFILSTTLFDVLGLLLFVMVTRCVVRSNMQWGEAMKCELFELFFCVCKNA